jgi:rhodanese-related sulfurtransferase
MPAPTAAQKNPPKTGSITISNAALSAVQYFEAKLAYEMTPWTLKSLVDKGAKDVILLDVRSPDYYAQGHIPGAKNVPLDQLAAAMKTLPKDKTVITYCANFTCALAPKAALTLAKEGFKVMELYGGIQEWTEKGFPVEKKA